MSDILLPSLTRFPCLHEDGQTNINSTFELVLKHAKNICVQETEAFVELIDALWDVKRRELEFLHFSNLFPYKQQV